jgi:predicted nucleic acid-binding Zn ribbon protein
MPTYVYKNYVTGETIEKEFSMGNAPDFVDEKEQRFWRIVSLVNVAFKGPGFTRSVMDTHSNKGVNK